MKIKKRILFISLLVLNIISIPYFFIKMFITLWEPHFYLRINLHILVYIIQFFLFWKLLKQKSINQLLNFSLAFVIAIISQYIAYDFINFSSLSGLAVFIIPLLMMIYYMYMLIRVFNDAFESV